MRKTTLFAVAVAAAALIATGLGEATSPTNARVPGHGIDPHQMMMNASAIPTTEFVDYSFVFVH